MIYAGNGPISLRKERKRTKKNKKGLFSALLGEEMNLRQSGKWHWGGDQEKKNGIGMVCSEIHACCYVAKCGRRSSVEKRVFQISRTQFLFRHNKYIDR